MGRGGADGGDARDPGGVLVLCGGGGGGAAAAADGVRESGGVDVPACGVD